MLVENVGDAAAHACGKIPSTAAKDEDDTFRHILTAVIADALDYGGCSRVAHSEAFARNSVEESFAAGGAVQSDVADDDVFFRGESRLPRRINNNLAAGKSLADVVVGVAFERERDALRQKCTQALSRRSGEMDADGIVRQTGRAIAAGDLTAQDSADGTVNVAHRQVNFDRTQAQQRVERMLD